MNYALKYKAVDLRPAATEKQNKGKYHIRHNRLKRFSKVYDSFTDSLFEQCSSYCDTADHQACESNRNQAKIQPIMARKQSLNKTFKKKKSLSRQNELKQSSTITFKTFDKKEIKRSLRSVGRIGLKSLQRHQPKKNSGDNAKMAKGIMKNSVNHTLFKKSSNIIAKFTPSQSVSIMSVTQKEEARKLSDVSNISNTIPLESSSESSPSMSASLKNNSGKYKKEICLKRKYGPRKIRKKIDIDQRSMSKSQRIKDLVEKPIIEFPLKKKKTQPYEQMRDDIMVTEPIETKETTFEDVFTPKEENSFSNRATILDICNEASNDSVIFDTPMACENTGEKVSSLIKPLRRENYRDQIMPSKIDTQINSFRTPCKRTSMAKKCESASCNKKSLALDTLRENTLKDKKIAALEDTINQLQMENSDLRELLNRFMIIKLED
ncbi:unnamed protein product [Moneuplotes crassus]|uniref:Uncharacterized protein n=1 Tax=Euplotes crassus TaxID=5936 RepID=A0AAD1UHP6_EUPCR|nr:unnamed protein product [Moneuplotes crassus]